MGIIKIKLKGRNVGGKSQSLKGQFWLVRERTREIEGKWRKGEK